MCVVVKMCGKTVFGSKYVWSIRDASPWQFVFRFLFLCGVLLDIITEQRSVTTPMKRGLLLHTYREVCYCTYKERPVTTHIEGGLLLHTYREVCYYTHKERCVTTRIKRGLLLHT